MSIAVRLITPEDYDVFRALRLESLTLLPANFAADPVQAQPDYLRSARSGLLSER